MPRKVSFVAREIWHALTWLNQSKTHWVNNLVNTHSIKECSIESLSPQYAEIFIVRLNTKSESFFLSYYRSME